MPAGDAQFRDMIAVGGVDPYPRGVFIAQNYAEAFGVLALGRWVQVVRLGAEELQRLAASGHPELVRARDAALAAGAHAGRIQ